MPTVEFARPTSLPEAVETLRHYETQARCLAGGTDLVIAMRNKGVVPRCIVDLKHIPELRQVTWETPVGGGAPDLIVGAAVPMSRLAAMRDLRRLCGGLVEAIETVGAYPLRTRATLGGNIGNASPAADTVPPLLAMDALVEVEGPAGRRAVPLCDMFLRPGRTVLQTGELIAAVRIPAASLGGRSRYLKLGRRRAMELAIVGVAVHQHQDDRTRIAFASVAPTPLRARATESALSKAGDDTDRVQVAVAAALEEVKPIGDARASREYRRHLVAVLLRRGLEAVREEAA